MRTTYSIVYHQLFIDKISCIIYYYFRVFCYEYTHLADLGRKLIFKNLAMIKSTKYLCELNTCSLALTVGCLWGQKGQRITKDSPQQLPVSVSEACNGEWGQGNDIQWYLITCNTGTLSAALIENHFADMRDVHMFRVTCVQHVSQPEWCVGLES